MPMIQPRQNAYKYKIMQRIKMALLNSTKDIQKKTRLRDRTDRAWFSRLLRHPARKESGLLFQTGAHKVPNNARARSEMLETI